MYWRCGNESAPARAERERATTGCGRRRHISYSAKNRPPSPQSVRLPYRTETAPAGVVCVDERARRYDKYSHRFDSRFGAPGMRYVAGTFLLLVAITGGVLCQVLYEGDACQLRDGSPGICTDATECPWFLEVIVKNKRFAERVTCGFDGSVEVICCKSNGTAAVRPPGLRSRLACEKVPKYTSRLTFHIIDGEEASDGEFPFMAALGYPTEDEAQNVSYRCGASLISPNFLLTAAHCIPTADRPTVAILGTNNLAPGNHGVVVAIKAFFPHPEYRTNRNYHDIALIQLERPIENEPDVNPICLYDDPNDLPKDTVLTAEGYGIIDLDRNDRSNQLMKVNLTTVPWQTCNQTFADSNLLKNNRKLPRGIVATQYCVTGRENEDTKVVGDTCQGDSGGPLQILDDGKYKLVGVTSFGNGCGSSTPSVSSRVAAYIDWIENTVWG
uniref:CLIP domain-containing serine protease n=1 Tax=Anopheles farauti TaxID=69004 RepID=A0A182PZZ7_9DIPT